MAAAMASPIAAETVVMRDRAAMAVATSECGTEPCEPAWVVMTENPPPRPSDSRESQFTGAEFWPRFGWPTDHELSPDEVDVGRVLDGEQDEAHPDDAGADAEELGPLVRPEIPESSVMD
jgi:hypothetical protein